MSGLDGSDINLEKTCVGIICLGHLGNVKLQNSYAGPFFGFYGKRFIKNLQHLLNLKR